MSQLRDFGVGNVLQAARPTDARRQLEFRGFDFCSVRNAFPNEAMSGQDLLDDLRRNQLPFSTIFIMITGEATYARGEAADPPWTATCSNPTRPCTWASACVRPASASYRCKESCRHRGRGLRNRRQSVPAALRVQGMFWLYAARVGELLLRVADRSDAQQLYKAVVAAKTLPWAAAGCCPCAVRCRPGRAGQQHIGKPD